MEYVEWLAGVSPSIVRDSLWKFETYRKALYLADLAWVDCEKLLGDHRGRAIAWQLIDSAGSVSANVEEGYGRGFGKDYARFLRIALGSARETRGWYWRGRHILGVDLVSQRLSLIDSVIAGLVTTSEQQKRLGSK